MKNKENKNIKEEPRKLTKLDDDQIDAISGGADITVDIAANANPVGGISRSKIFGIDDKIKENG